MLNRLRRFFLGKSEGEQETQPIPEGVELEGAPRSLLRHGADTGLQVEPREEQGAEPSNVKTAVDEPVVEPKSPAAGAGSRGEAGGESTTAPVDAAPGKTPSEDPQAYLARVQEKINKLAEEFATGAINQAQFQELYEHYQKEQQTVKRWLQMEPDSDAWQEATTEGQSVLIRADNLARVVGYAIYENNSGMPLNTIGQFEVDPELVVPMLSSYRAATREIFGAGMRSSEIEGGRWLCFVPGEFTTLMALFSKSPSTRQLDSLEELHRLFERANRYFLQEPNLQPGDLVFPHTHFIGRMD